MFFCLRRCGTFGDAQHLLTGCIQPAAFEKECRAVPTRLFCRERRNKAEAAFCCHKTKNEVRHADCEWEGRGGDGSTSVYAAALINIQQPDLKG